MTVCISSWLPTTNTNCPPHDPKMILGGFFMCYQIEYNNVFKISRKWDLHCPLDVDNMWRFSLYILQNTISINNKLYLYLAVLYFCYQKENIWHSTIDCKCVSASVSLCTCFLKHTYLNPHRKLCPPAADAATASPSTQTSS